MKKIKKSLLAVILFFLFVCSADCESFGPFAESNYYYPVADAYVYEKSGSTFGSDTELRVGHQSTNNFDNMRSALKFDTSAIPENSKINEAYLYAYSFDTKPSWDFRSIQAYSAPNIWSESVMNWSQLDDISAQIHDSSFINGIPGSSPDMYSWDITDIVQSWVSGKTNYGVVLQCDSEDFDDYIIIYSNDNLLYKPYLNVIYTPPAMPSPDTQLSKAMTIKTNNLTTDKTTADASVVNPLVNETKTEDIAGHTIVHVPENKMLTERIQTPAHDLPPAITYHPVSQTKNPGTSVIFIVTASGAPPVSFQWIKDGVKIDGANSKRYTIDSVCENDEGTFTCRITNDAGSITSNPAELQVNDPVNITQQPQSISTIPGKKVTFCVKTIGTPPFSFQWEKDSLDIRGAADKAYVIASVQKKDAGVYRCKVSDTFSQIISKGAQLSLADPPQITQHPQSQLLNSKMPVTFSVSVSGTLPLSFQWIKDGVEIDGETSDSYTIGSVSIDDGGYFTCRVTNDAGSEESNAAELYVTSPPGAAAPEILNDAGMAFKSDPDPGSALLESNAICDNDIKCPQAPTFHPGTGTYHTFLHVTPSVSGNSVNSFYTINGSAPDTGSTPWNGKPIYIDGHHGQAVNLKMICYDSLGHAGDIGSVDYLFDKHLPIAINYLSLTAPDGQGQYVHNGNILMIKGSAPPNASLISARLVDDQGCVIRDVSKGLNMAPDTGDISGSTFVGSFRGAASVHLIMMVHVPTGKQPVKGISNSLSVDNSYPEVLVTEPINHSYFKTAPIMIYGTAFDKLSGVASVEISFDGGFTYCSVDSFKDGQWKYSFKPTTPDTVYNIKLRSTDIVGLATVSENLIIHYNSPAPAVNKLVRTNKNNTADYSRKNTNKAFDDNGICTYRVTDLKNSRFQPTELFSVKEEMAIIVKGYGGNKVTVKIIVPSSGKVVFELTDYIPVDKHKMWKWKLSATGTFQAALFVDGIQKDDVIFKIIQ